MKRFRKHETVNLIWLKQTAKMNIRNPELQPKIIRGHQEGREGLRPRSTFTNG